VEKVKSNDWVERIPKIMKAGAILAIIGVFLPSTHAFESIYGYSFVFFIWFFGLIWATVAGESDTLWMGDVYGPAGDDFTMYGITAMVILIFAFILMIAGSNYAKDGRNNKLSAATGLFGGILAFVGPGVFYFGVRSDFPGFWTAFDPSIGVYLPIIAGFLGIIGAIAAGYAFSLENKGELREKVPYQPTPDKMVIDKEPGVTSQEEMPVFCKNCGTKLAGEFCQECGQKAEFLIH